MIRRWFGRITPERQRQALHAEAMELEKRFRYAATHHGAVSRRALIDMRHATALAEHYANEARIFSTQPTTGEQSDH